MSSEKPGEVDSIIQAAELMAEDHIDSAPSAPLPPEQVTLSSGVVLEVYTGMSLSAINDIDERFPDPPVPVIEKDGRKIENPASPSYQKQLERNGKRKGIAVVDSIIILCTRLVSSPPDIDDPDSEVWAEKLELLGYAQPKGRLGRYLLWVKLVAAPTDQDWAMLASAAARRVGVREEDVQQALATFPDNGEGATNPAGETEE